MGTAFTPSRAARPFPVSIALCCTVKPRASDFSLLRSHHSPCAAIAISLAGLALGCLVFKPHWVAVAGAVFVAAREWRVVTGVVASAAAQLGVVGLIVGPAVMSAYWERLRSIQRISRLLEPRPGNTLNGLLTAVIPWEAAALASMRRRQYSC